MVDRVTRFFFFLLLMNCVGCTIIYEYEVIGKLVDSHSGLPIVGALISIDSSVSTKNAEAKSDSKGDFRHTFAHSDGDYFDNRLRAGESRTITIEHAEYGKFQIEVSPTAKPKYVNGNEVRVLVSLARNESKEPRTADKSKVPGAESAE